MAGRVMIDVKADRGLAILKLSNSDRQNAISASIRDAIGKFARAADDRQDIILSGGLNVYPRKVEGVLDSLTGDSKSAVFGVPHPDCGEAVVAMLELGPGRRLRRVQSLARGAATTCPL